MKIQNLILNILMLMLLTEFSAFAEEQERNKNRVFTNSDLKKYRQTTETNSDDIKSTGEVRNNNLRRQTNSGYMEPESDSIVSKTTLEPNLRRQWEGLKAALKQRNIDLALTYFVDSQKSKQKQIFEQIKDKLPGIIDTYIEFNIKEIYGNAAEYEIVARQNGQLNSYPGRMVKDHDGVWRFYDF